jgi:anti-sigma factor RsiW
MSDDRLHDYFDGEMTPEEAARFERALAADADLRERLRALRELDDALGGLPGAEPAAGFTGRVVRAARRPRARILRFLAPLAAAAAVTFAVLALRNGAVEAPAEVPGYRWEADIETYGSLSLADAQDLILAELENS